MSGDLHCPLCAGLAISAYCNDGRRAFVVCDGCALVFVSPGSYLSRQAEKAEYDLHQNRINDPGYRAFLSRLMQPLVQRLPPAAKGLDFGCGPGPALAQMLRESGFDVALYDPFYFPSDDVLGTRYDFICATEVVEHLHHPGSELDRLWSRLLPGGWLGVMTKLVSGREAFAKWHYKNDPTHVCFFSVQTWRWWAERHGAAVEFVGADVILLQRNGQSDSDSMFI